MTRRKEMKEIYSLLLLLCTSSQLLQLHRVSCTSGLSYDYANDYLEVYPDPTDPGILLGRTPLFFALIQSLGGQFDGSGSVAGVKVALDRINSDMTLLPGYSLHYTLADSMCDRMTSLKAFFSQILREPTKLAVIGSGCSPATEPTAEISHFYNISQISCVSSSTELRNRVRFPYYFQLLSTEETLAFAYFGVIQKYGWRKLTLLVQNENLFTVTINKLEDLLDGIGVNYTYKQFDSDQGILDLSQPVFDRNSRIFLLAMYAVHARPFLCEAYRRGIKLPSYLLLTPGWYSGLWWRMQDAGLSCTVQQRESVLSSSLAFLHFNFLNASSEKDLNRMTTTGITGREFLTEEKAFLGSGPLNLTFLDYSQYCYDATWTLAYALNSTLNSIGDATLNQALAEAFNTQSTFNLSDFNYNSDELLQVIFRHIKNTSFNGVTGPVHFGREGVRTIHELTIFQFRNTTNSTDGSQYLDWVNIGAVVPGDDDTFNFMYNTGESDETLWQGLVPYDGVALEVTKTVNLVLVVFCVVIATSGILYAIVCLVFNFYFRNTKLIKLASSKLNSLIIVGAIILYVDIIFAAVPSTNVDVISVFCNLTPWMTAIGYSLCYGTILFKMARVYYIFYKPSTNKKAAKDWLLVLGVFLLVLVDVCIILVYTVVVGVQGGLRATRVVHLENPQDTEGVQGIITDNFIYICTSTSRDIFLGVLYGYKMALQVVALLLAFSIRKVKIKGLDDSKYVAAAIYVTSLVLAVIIVSNYSVRNYINAFTALFFAGFFLGTTVILVLVFTPLMISLYKDPKGEKIFSKVYGGNGDHTLMTIGSGPDNGAAVNVIAMRSKVIELEAELVVARDQNVQLEESYRKTSFLNSLDIPNSKGVVFKDGKTIWDIPDDNENVDEYENALEEMV